MKINPEVSLRLFNIAELSELPDSNGLTSPATALLTKLTVIVLIAQKATLQEILYRMSIEWIVQNSLE